MYSQLTVNYFCHTLCKFQIEYEMMFGGQIMMVRWDGGVGWEGKLEKISPNIRYGKAGVNYWSAVVPTEKRIR